jgi:hypothetical protein
MRARKKWEGGLSNALGWSRPRLGFSFFSVFHSSRLGFSFFSALGSSFFSARFFILLGSRFFILLGSGFHSSRLGFSFFSARFSVKEASSFLLSSGSGLRVDVEDVWRGIWALTGRFQWVKVSVFYCSRYFFYFFALCARLSRRPAACYTRNYLALYSELYFRELGSLKKYDNIFYLKHGTNVMMRFKQRCKADTNVMRRVWVEIVSSFFVYFREIGPGVSSEKIFLCTYV